ncbi:MAG: hypothetical protein SFV55_13135 [Haliscomenobacter sp.]|uniref:hypothetical protein n=1 Tax=Haliscomenobacter sp. TaxID=2717303 RepID=UPI0029AA998F|nr:hypothetical protein [Haliscomenobacter sp.]MDX2069363.1 hypothetical protein [Haliscomenobacter sp.]
MEYKIKDHGDGLELQAADFISVNISAYESIWKNFIGHQGNGQMATMKKITADDEAIRQNFAQHHYTVLESLYFMQLIVDDESKTKEINSFEDYRKASNQIMAYHAYSGRLRDNIEKCFLSLGQKNGAKKACEELDTFYHQRHVFIHGRKVPFLITTPDNLFKIAHIKGDTDSNRGFGLEMSWNSMNSPDDFIYLEDALKKSIDELKYLVNNLLHKILGFVLDFIESRNLEITPPGSNNYTPESPNNIYTATSGSNFGFQNSSGSFYGKDESTDLSLYS